MESPSNEDPSQPVVFLELTRASDQTSQQPFVFNQNLIKRIVGDFGDHRIVVIGIVGGSAERKSATFNSTVSCLEKLEARTYRTAKKSATRKSSIPLVAGNFQHKSCLLMWNRLFRIKIDNEIVVVCLITTLLGKSSIALGTDKLDDLMLNQLTILLSSSLIFHISNDTDESLDVLEPFIKYGTELKQVEETAGTNLDSRWPPFQNLSFIVEDDNDSCQINGKTEVLNYFEIAISTKSDSNVPQSSEVFKYGFRKTSCYSLPPVKNTLPPLVKKMLENILEVNSRDIKYSAVLGHPIYSRDLHDVINIYCNAVAQENLTPTTILNAQSDVVLCMHSNQYIYNFINSMENALKNPVFPLLVEFQNLQEVNKGEILITVTLPSGIETSGLDRFKVNVKNRLDQESQQFKRRYHDVKQDRLKTILADCSTTYVQFVDDHLLDIHDFLEEDTLTTLSNGEINSIILFAQSEIKKQFREEIHDISNIVAQHIEDVRKRFVSSNASKSSTADELATQLIKRIINTYNTDLLSHVRKHPCISDEEFMEYKILAHKHAHSTFESNIKYKMPFFLSKQKQNLESELLNHTTAADEIRKSQVDSLNRIAESSLCDAHEQIKIKLLTLNETCHDTLAVREGAKSILDEVKLEFINHLSQNKESKFWNSYLKKIDACFQSELDSLLTRRENFEMGCKVVVNDASMAYGINLKDQIAKQQLHSAENLAKIHEDCYQHAVRMLNDFINQHPFISSSDYLTKLEALIQGRYNDAVVRNQEKRNAFEKQAERYINDCATTYQLAMSQNIDKAFTEEDLVSLNRQFTQKALDELTTLLNAAVYQDNFDITTYLEKLQRDITTVYVSEIKFVFEMKSPDRENRFQLTLSAAHELYHKEMTKHVTAVDFLNPRLLNEIHVNVLELVQRKWIEPALLSVERKNAITTALKKTFEAGYKETNDMNSQDELAIGIDLGTTNSCVGVFINGKVEILDNAGQTTTPSYVAYTENNAVKSVGKVAKNNSFVNFLGTIYDSKRMLGKPFTDTNLQHDMGFWPFKMVEVKGIPNIVVNGNKILPEEVSAEILKEMRAVAERKLQRQIRKVVITVPAYFTDGQRQATKDAGESAGLHVLNVLNEPTAAAIAYKMQQTDGVRKLALIFDLGGGTFDVAVIETKTGNIEVLAADGDAHLGGEDFDQHMMEFCVAEFKRQFDIDLFKGKDSKNIKESDNVRSRLKRLQLECEVTKLELTSADSAQVLVDNIYRIGAKTYNMDVTITRDAFNKMNSTLFSKTITIVERVLESAGRRKEDIDDVVLIGGSTRIPKIQELLRKHFSGKNLYNRINGEEAVAYGAAIHAAILNGKITQSSKDFNAIQDVTTMSIGLEVFDGEFSNIIPKNSKLPVTIKEKFQTAHNNQTSVQIVVYQGEHTMAKDNVWLGEFYINGIPPAPALQETIEVTMEIGIHGVLNVTAVCTTSEASDSIVISEHKSRMERETIQRLAAKEHANRNPITRIQRPSTTIENEFLHPNSIKRDDQKFEFVFLLDNSSSMIGGPIKLAKAALNLILQSLPKDCYFNVITFNTSFQPLFSDSVLYGQETLEKAKLLVNDIIGTGSTNILNPLRHVYSKLQIPGYLTQIFIITDGCVENRDTVLSLVEDNVKRSRIFSLGIGNSVDRRIVTEMSNRAGGSSEFVNGLEPIETSVLHQLKKAQKPALLKPIRVTGTIPQSQSQSA